MAETFAGRTARELDEMLPRMERAVGLLDDLGDRHERLLRQGQEASRLTGGPGAGGGSGGRLAGPVELVDPQGRPVAVVSTGGGGGSGGLVTLTGRGDPADAIRHSISGSSSGGSTNFTRSGRNRFPTPTGFFVGGQAFVAPGASNSSATRSSTGLTQDARHVANAVNQLSQRITQLLEGDGGAGLRARGGL